jgi:hypothetical protein
VYKEILENAELQSRKKGQETGPHWTVVPSKKDEEEEGEEEDEEKESGRCVALTAHPNLAQIIKKE